MTTLLAALTIAMSATQPALATPSPRQLLWHPMETNAFIHFGPNTFTDKEWGEGLEDPAVFAPTGLDCRQWTRALKAAGMKGVVLTAKHHDGFCLWPSKLSKHTVAQSPFRGGKGDVVRELADACRADGLKLGIYLSPWDRNHPTYGTPEYNDVFVGMLDEVLTQYGEIFEVWFDGACGEGPNGKRQVYDWPRFVATVRKHQPNAVIFSDAGPDLRWVGNEEGHAPETSWATIDRDRYVPGTPLSGELGEGKEGGTHWVPAECDVSIRPGWFYHASEDDRVKSPDVLEDLYCRSVGHGGSFLLNVPPDRRGLLHENDVASLAEFGWRIRATYGRDLAAGGRITDGETWRTLELPQAARFDRVVIQEDVTQGQRIRSFRVTAADGGGWRVIGEGTTVGWKRIVRVPAITARRVRVEVLDSNGRPALKSVTLHLAASG